MIGRIERALLADYRRALVCRKCGAALVRVRDDGQEVCVAGHGVYPAALPTAAARRFVERHNEAVGHQSLSFRVSGVRLPRRRRTTSQTD